MTPRTRATLAISAAAVVVFAALRSLPDTACGFLHLHESKVSAEGLEYCAPGEVALFADPRDMKFPVTAKLEPDAPLVSGKTTHVTLRLYAPNGNPLRPGEIAFSHTKRVHLLIADPSIDAYRHLHPEPEGSSGEWGFEFTPTTGGEHVFFIDCVHTLTKRPQIIRLTLPVSGEVLQAQPKKGTSWTGEDGLVVGLSGSGKEFRTGSDIALTLKFTGKDGAPVKLLPVMAAYAHLVAFDPARTGFAHLHPLQTEKEKDASPELNFRFRTEKPGRYRLWAQFDTGAGERFAPFDIEVR